MLYVLQYSKKNTNHMSVKRIVLRSVITVQKSCRHVIIFIWFLIQLFLGMQCVCRERRYLMVEER